MIYLHWPVSFACSLIALLCMSLAQKQAPKLLNSYCQDRMPHVCASTWKTKCYRESVKQQYCHYTCNKESCDRSNPSLSNSTLCAKNNSLTNATFETFQEASLTFAVDLYQSFRLVAPSSNVIFSPASISIALAMVLAGAEDTTYVELKHEFLPDIPELELYNAFLWLLGELNRPSNDYELYTANAVYLQEELKLELSFEEAIAKCLSSDVMLEDFTSEPDAVRQSVNQWVEEKTAKKIRDLLPRGSVNALTKLILVNAVYFKAEWLRPFSTGGSAHETTFFTLDNTPKTVTMMSQTAEFLYSVHDDMKVLGLPYKNNELTMYILLPNKRQGLPDLESTLTTERLTDVLEKTIRNQVAVTMPKFKMEHNFPLKKLLQDMGVKQLFTEDADLSGITKDGNLFVTDAFHKAFIEVNERGTEAAAATGMVVGAKSMPRNWFRADHPFIFLIRHQTTKAILFMGALLDVTE